MLLKVNDWNDYQHYKDRSPPWIKAHTKMIDNRKWRALTDAQKGQLLAIWLLASRLQDAPGTDATVPNDPSYLSALTGCSINEKSLQSLVDKGFLVPCKQDASGSLASCSPETETETETETDARALPPALSANGFAEKWNEWLAHRRSMGWSVRKKWQGRQLKMLAKYGSSKAIAALDQSMAQGWQGVFPEKLADDQVRRRAKPGEPKVDCSHCDWSGPASLHEAHLEIKHGRTA